MDMKMSTGSLTLLMMGLASVSIGSMAVADLEDCKIRFDFQHEGHLESSEDFVWPTIFIFEAFYESGTFQLPGGRGPIGVSVGDYSGTDLFNFDHITLTESEPFAADVVVFGASYDRGAVRIELLTGIDW